MFHIRMHQHTHSRDRCIAANQLWVPHDVLPEFLREVSRALRKHTQARQATTRREDEILELVRRRLSTGKSLTSCRSA